MAIGMQARIKEELEYLSTSSQYSERLKVRCFKFHSPPAKENYTAWLGGETLPISSLVHLLVLLQNLKNLMKFIMNSITGAIYGATDFVTTKSLSKEAYLRERKVPDWVNLIHNTFNVGTKRSV